ncbi:CHRD domain-containing protein [Massilia sp. SM-13]|uniref:CHRD domain-containing protein n=1 Tax=Pseudoduganella rhizocola TaxID=3382643 RepID=UPI0038B50BE1
MKSLILALVLAVCGAPVLADSYSATLTGAQEATPNASPAIGAAIVTFDVTSHTLTVGTVFTDLLGTVTAAHIHCCVAPPATAGVATMVPTFTGFPSGVSEGTYLMSFDTSLASTWNATFIANNGGTTAGAEAALLAGLDAGMAYLNIHTTLYPGGEIRGFLAPAPVPEPASAMMLLLGVPLAIGIARRRRT